MTKNSITAGQRLFANSKINSSLKKNNSFKTLEQRSSLKSPNSDQIIFSNSLNNFMISPVMQADNNPSLIKSSSLNYLGKSSQNRVGSAKKSNQTWK